MKLLLVSASSGSAGHGEVYLTNLYVNSIAQQKNVFVPLNALSNNSKIPVQNTFYSGKSVDALARSNYKKWGKFGLIKRGIDRIVYNIKFYKSLKQHLNTQDYDTVHILDSEYVAFYYFYKRIKHSKIRFIYTLHASDFDLAKLSIQSTYKYMVKGLLNIAFKRVDHVMCHGDWIKGEILKAFPILKNKITGLDYPSNSYSSFDKLAVKSKLNLPLNKTIISFLGMLRRDKKLETALETLQKLPEEYHLLVAGSLADYTLYEIKTLIKKRGLEHRTTLMLKYLSTEEYQDCFRSTDIFLSTHSQNFPSASGPVSDARSYAIPVVVPPFGQLKYYVNTYLVGEVAKNHDAKSFADACHKIKTDLSSYIQNTKETSVKLSWQSFANHHTIVYEDRNI